MHIHTHIRSGVKVKREVPVRKYLLHSLSFVGFFPLFFLGISLLCALPERSLLFVRPIIVVALGLGWAGRLGRLTEGSFFFWFFSFFIQATGERGRCVDNNNNNNNVTRVDPSRSLSRYDGYYYHHHHHTSELLLLLLRAEQYSKKEKIKTTSRTLGLTDVHQDSQ